MAKGTTSAGGSLVFSNGEADTSSTRIQWMLQPRTLSPTNIDTDSDGYGALTLKLVYGSAATPYVYRQLTINNMWDASGMSGSVTAKSVSAVLMGMCITDHPSLRAWEK